MSVEYFDKRVQITHNLSVKECQEVDAFLKKNPDKEIRLIWFKDVKNLDFISKISNTKKICINHCSIANLDFLASLPDLELLDIGEMDSYVDISAIKHLKNLKVLNLSLRKKERQTNLSVLDGLHLEELYLSGNFKKNSLNLNILKHVKILAPQLKTINLEELNDLENLKLLKIFNQKVTSLKGIEKLKSLESLFLFNVKMDDQTILSPIFELPKLTNLHLSYLNFIEDFTFIKHTHNLKLLNLWTLNGLKNYKGIEHLTALKTLQHAGEHKQGSAIDFSNIKQLKTLKELEIKVGKVSAKKKEEIKVLIDKIIN